MAEPHIRSPGRLLRGLPVAAILALALALPLTAGWLGRDQDQCRSTPGPESPLLAAYPTSWRLPWDESPLWERQMHYWPVVRRLSEREGMDPALVMAVVHVESRFDPWAVSEAGAQGLMQINPVTAAELGLDNPLDPEDNLRAGIRYLSSLKKTFRNDMVLALAAYNAGPTKVHRAGGALPDIDETRLFVNQVLAQADNYRDRFQGIARR